MKVQRESAVPDALTGRELDILRLIAEGYSNDEIARRLVITIGTVKWYNTQIFDKLGVKNRTQAILRSRELNLLDDTPDAPSTRSAARPAGARALPAQTTPLLGREQELARISSLLMDSDCRLLTLVGPGGIGKTRLAVAAAERYGKGALFVNLSPLRVVDDLIPALASALSMTFSGNRSLKEQILEVLEDRSLLLLLDNFEHLVDGASLISEILMAAPGIRVLVTSRVRLQLQEETVFRVEGLPVTDSAGLDELRQNTAVQLFVQSAHRIRPDRAFDEADWAAINQVCRLVEGVPLAIILAAGWVELLTPSEIAAEITQCLDFLQTDLRNIPERQRSIRSIYESAWRMLNPEEQAVFSSLSVFVGGFSREAARNISGASLHSLMGLVNRSLVARDSHGRFDLHELLRQFAREKLLASGRSSDAFRAHSAYYLTLVRQYASGSPDIDVLGSDFDNVRTGWDYALEQNDWSTIQITLESLYRYCTTHSRYPDALSAFEKAMTLAEHASLDQTLLTRLQECRGRLRGLAGELDGAVADLQAARNGARAAGDISHEREILIHLGHLYRKAENLNVATRYLKGVLELAETSGNQRTVADSLYHLGTVAWDEGEWLIDHDRQSTALEISQRLGLRDIIAVQATHGLGEAMLGMGRPEAAIQLFSQSRDMAHDIGDLSYETENWQMIGWAASGHIGIGDYTLAKEAYMESIRRSEDGHLMWHHTCNLTGLGFVLAAMGDYEQGLAITRDGLALSEQMGIRRFMAMAYDHMGDIYRDLGLLEQAEAAHEQAVNQMYQIESTFWLPRSLANLAIDRIRLGRLDVDDDLQAALEMARSRGQAMHATRCLEGLAELAVTRGEGSVAASHADRLLEHSVTGSQREGIAWAHYWRGRALILLQQPYDARLALLKALTGAEEIGRFRLRADVRLALADLESRLGDPSAASRWLDEGQALMEHINRQASQLTRISRYA